MAVRKYLHAAGLRFRLHVKSIQGKPDLVFPSRRIALFVHGCFWHQHPACKRARMPKGNAQYWIRKLARNAERDQSITEALGIDGWQVVVIWECETRNSERLDAVASQIRATPSR